MTTTRTTTKRAGWTKVCALLLAGLLGVQGCSAVGSAKHSPLAAGNVSSVVDGPAMRVTPGAMRFLEGNARGELVPVVSGVWSLSGGEAMALAGVLVLLLPVIIVFGVLSAPFALFDY